MRSVVAIRARSISAALILTVLTTPLFIDTRPVARGDDKLADKPLPAELAKAIRDGDLKAVRAQLDGGVDVNVRDANGNTPLLLAAVYAGPGRPTGPALSHDWSPEAIEWFQAHGGQGRHQAANPADHHGEERARCQRAGGHP